MSRRWPNEGVAHCVLPTLPHKRQLSKPCAYPPTYTSTRPMLTRVSRGTVLRNQALLQGPELICVHIEKLQGRAGCGRDGWGGRGGSEPKGGSPSWKATV